MKLQDGIDFTTLNWVKQELDETLKQARQALEAYVEDPADSSLMRFCATYLHQVQGTLRMVELYGAAMVVEEMERVALALLDGNVKPQDETYAVLMRGIVQLPDYLERLQSGHKDIPIVLLPLLNDLRAYARRKTADRIGAVLAGSVRADAERVRRAGRDAGNGTEVRSRASAHGVPAVAAALDPRRSAAGATRSPDRRARSAARGLRRKKTAQRLWWVSSGVLESVASGAQETNVALKLLFGKVDREIKRLLDGGEASFRTVTAGRTDQESSLLRRALRRARPARDGNPRRSTNSTRCCRAKRNSSTPRVRSPATTARCSTRFPPRSRTT